MKLQSTFMVAAGAVVLGVFTLSAQETKSQWDGIYTADQAKRGQAVYGEKCAYCHAKNLVGYIDPDNPAPSLAGDNFAANWDKQPLSNIYDKIAKSMPQDQPGSLTPEENADVLAFMLSYGKYPAGTTDLPSKGEQLKAFKFLAKK